MTVSSELNRKTFAGDAVTTSFGTSPVVFFDTSDLVVFVVDSSGTATTLVENTGYTVTGGAGSTGTVDLSSGSSPHGAVAAGSTLVIVRTLPLTQETDFVQNDSSDAEVAEDALDRAIMIAQQINARVDRSFVLADSDVSGVDLELPAATAAARGDKVIGFKTNGIELELKGPVDNTLLAAQLASTDTGNGAALVGFLPSGTGAIPSDVQAELRENITPFQFGGVGDGVANDSAAILAASVAAVAQGKDVDFSGHTWLMGTALSLTSSHNGLRWRLRGATLKKGFSGSLVTLTDTANFSIDGVGIIDGQHGTFTGKGFVFSGSGSTTPFLGPGIVMENFTDSHIEFGADAGQYAKVMCNFYPGSGQTDFRAVHCTGTDTGAMHRKIIGSTAVGGYHDLDAAEDTIISASAFARVEIDADCLITQVVGCNWGNGGTAMTASGTATYLIGNRFAGAVTLDADFSGQFIGNEFTSGSLTDSSVGLAAAVFHKPGGTIHVLLGKTSLPAWSAQRVQTSLVQSCGDQNQTYSVGFSGPTMRYADTLSADRTVTLSTDFAFNGDRMRVTRSGGNSGGPWVVHVGALIDLDQGQWADVEFDGTNWVLTAFGALS